MGFKLPKRYDNNVAREGVFFDIHTEAGDKVGSFKCRYLDQYSVEIDTIRNRIRNKHSKALRDRNAYDLLSVALLLAEEIVTDWEGICDDETGEEIPFSVEKAIEFFCVADETVRYTAMKLSELAGDPTNFGAEPAGDFIKN